MSTRNTMRILISTISLLAEQAHQDNHNHNHGKFYHHLLVAKTSDSTKGPQEPVCSKKWPKGQTTVQSLVFSNVTVALYNMWKVISCHTDQPEMSIRGQCNWMGRYPWIIILEAHWICAVPQWRTRQDNVQAHVLQPQRQRILSFHCTFTHSIVRVTDACASSLKHFLDLFRLTSSSVSVLFVSEQRTKDEYNMFVPELCVLPCLNTRTQTLVLKA